MTDTFTIRDGYDRNKTPRTWTVRRMTESEIRSLGYGDEVTFIALDGSGRRLRLNGAVRTWKRDPMRLEIPIKYGLREYATFSLADALSRFLVIVD